MSPHDAILRERAEFTIGRDEDGCDVGTALKRRGFSRRLVTKLKRRENGITLNGVQARTVDKVHSGDILSAAMDGGENLEPNPQLCVPVVYEDEDVIVYDKPVNMPVHPSAGHHKDTLGNCFAAAFPNVTFRPINRLDKDTSGLCAVAKNAHSAAVLGGNIQKEYLAAVCGVIDCDGSISAPIGRAEESVIRRIVRPDGQRAVTNYTVVTGNDRYTLVRVILETGRTHQIRVHFAHIGHPLAGDDFYGGDISDTSFQALHCAKLTFTSPITGKYVSLESPIRDDMKKLFET